MGSFPVGSISSLSTALSKEAEETEDGNDVMVVLDGFAPSSAMEIMASPASGLAAIGDISVMAGGSRSGGKDVSPIPSSALMDMPSLSPVPKRCGELGRFLVMNPAGEAPAVPGREELITIDAVDMAVDGRGVPETPPKP